MLKKSYLQELTTQKQTTPENIYREYIQNVFLNFLYQKKKSSKMLFKGGTALKLAYGSPRFSEDLDFTLNNIYFKEIEVLLLKILNDLEKESFQPELIESKETTGGYLAELKVNFEEETVRILIQGSQRKTRKVKEEIKLIVNEYYPDYSAYLLKEEILVAEKVTAALTRSKPRDFFDVYFLLRGGYVPLDLRDKLLKINDILDEKEIDFENELIDFLPVSMQNLAKAFPKPLIRELNKYKN